MGMFVLMRGVLWKRAVLTRVILIAGSGVFWGVFFCWFFFSRDEEAPGHCENILVSWCVSCCERIHNLAHLKAPQCDFC